MTETGASETTRLLPAEHSILAATGNMGHIYRLGDQPGISGWYEAPVHDSATASRWGSLSSVSYTHLDVYKRQRPRFESKCCSAGA